MNIIEDVTLPGREGGAWVVEKGRHIRIIDVEGGPIGDFVCFNADKLSERFSQARTKANQGKFLLAVGMVEGIEELREGFFWNALPRIGHGHHDRIFASSSGRYPNRPSWRGEFNGIVDKVSEDLCEAILIGQNPQISLGKSSIQSLAFPLCKELVLVDDVGSSLR